MIKRIAGEAWVVLGVLVLTFLLLHLVPGDPVEVMLGESATQSDRQALREELGLNRPILEQFGLYITKLAHGNLGYSIHTKQPIADLLASRVPATFELAALALSIAVAVGLPLGIAAALHAGKWPDTMASFGSLCLSAMPHFMLGPILMLIFALALGWLPVSGMDARGSIILPAVTLGFGLAAILTRMTRASLLEVLNEDYVRTARAKGLPESQVIMRHALRNALLPIVTVIGLQLGSLLAGTVVTETVFSWNGVGSLLVESIEKRDYPVTQACVLVIALVYVTVNTLTDMAYSALDPRVKFLG